AAPHQMSPYSRSQSHRPFHWVRGSRGLRHPALSSAPFDGSDECLKSRPTGQLAWSLTTASVRAMALSTGAGISWRKKISRNSFRSHRSLKWITMPEDPDL
ncbi:unnamed protein product, partial [Oppiella nova]